MGNDMAVLLVDREAESHCNSCILFLPFRKFSSSVQENLFRGAGDLSDLVSINIQRGRERGIPGYTSYRNLKLCHLRKVNTFDDLVTVAGFSEEDKTNLQSQYESVHDIDLFTGGKCTVCG